MSTCGNCGLFPGNHLKFSDEAQGDPCPGKAEPHESDEACGYFWLKNGKTPEVVLEVVIEAQNSNLCCGKT